MLNFRLYTLLLITLLSMSVPLKTQATDNNAISENIIYLQDDGKSYLLHRTMHTDSLSYTFHVDKEYSSDDFYYVSPNNYEWDTASSDETNSLKFSQGNFAVIYPGRFNSNLKINEKGIYLFNSWDGKRRDDGLFGYWNTPSDFASFIYVWIVPEHFEILSYKSNRDGEWVKRDNTITFFAANTNSLAFEISYQLRDSDRDGVTDTQDSCPQTPANTEVNETGCLADSDHDTIVDSLDLCPDTAANLTVDKDGCEPDTDKDGVVDRLDQCPDTAVNLSVNDIGCELDSDKDGVINEKDLCPDSVADATVDETGCEHAAPINLEGVNFKTSSDQLLPESKLILDDVAAILAMHSGLIIEIDGHTDSAGDAENNMALSQQRAETVRDYLIFKGIPAETLTARGYGESLPLEDNATAEGRKRNRRVELKRVD